MSKAKRNGSVKFTDAEVELVKTLLEAGLSYAQVAAKWDAGKPMSKSTVAKIAQGAQHRYPTGVTR